MAASAQTAPELFLQASGTGDFQLDRYTRGPAIVRSQVVRINSSALRSLGAPGAGRLTLNLFPDTRVELQNTRRSRRPVGRGDIYRGLAADGSADRVVLTLRGGRITGNVSRSNGEFYRIRGLRRGLHLIQQVQYVRTGPFNDAVERPVPGAGQAAKLELPPAKSMAGDPVVDILIAYTPQARDEVGGAQDIEDLAQFTIDEMNDGFDNSGIPMQFRLVHTALFSPTQSEAAGGSFLSYVTDYTWNTEIDALHDLRDEYGADIVGVWIDGPGSNGGTVGIAWVMGNPGSGFADAAFSISEVNFVDGPAYTFAHEAGHNLGSSHERGNGSGGAYPYSWGYKKPAGSNRFTTIMSYGCSGCAPLNNWSNPDVTYFGNPTGVPSNQSDSADNRLTLANTGPIAAAWRAEVTPAQALPIVGTVTPSSGAGSSQTFSYTFSDPNGYLTLRPLIVVNEGLTGAGSCYLYYSAAQNELYLRNDPSTSWGSPATPGVSGVLQNGKCRIDASQAAATGNGADLNLTLPIEFLTAGAKTQWMSASDTSGLAVGWVARGTWNSGGSPPQPPIVGTVTPSSGAGSSQTFSYTFSDPNGYLTLRPLIVVNEGLTGAGSCYLYYSAAQNELYLRNDPSTSWGSPATPGVSGVLQNGKCRIDASQAAATGNGADLNLTLPIEFLTAGAKTQWMSASDTSGLAVGWVARGTWTAN